MIYSNPEFILLFLTLWFLYVPISTYWYRFSLLLTASWVFYSWVGPLDSLIFLLVIFVCWLSVSLAQKFPRQKKFFVGVGVFVTATHLLVWKYAPWLVSQIQILYPGFMHAKPLTLPLPVGISFFTLQGIAYLVDFGRGNAAYISFPKLNLFKSFFAQLVAGPIVRFWQLEPQLERLPTPRLEQVTLGLALFCLGFFKKLFIADRASGFIETVFLHPDIYGRGILLQALLGYSAQIWADFSGYVDMGRGAALMLGITLPVNFLSPYLSTRPSEFWRRWHITLSQWIRDFIYIPMGGNRGAPIKTAFVLLLTMAISGLWHGANWTFLIWGLYHGILLVIERWWEKGKTAAPRGVLATIPSMAIMFVLTAFGWLIFRAPSLELLGTFLRALWEGDGNAGSPINGPSVWMSVALCFGIQILFYYDFRKNNHPLLEKLIEPIKAALRTPILAGLACGVFLAALATATVFFRASPTALSFIYFQF